MLLLMRLEENNLIPTGNRYEREVFMRITFKHKGDLSKTTRFLERAKAFEIRNILEQYGQVGVAALSAATPVDSGATAGSWYYEIEVGNTSSRLIFYNSNENEGFPVAIHLQYGHGTGTGGWVDGRDYINPAIQPVFDEITNAAWREVTKL